MIVITTPTGDIGHQVLTNIVQGSAAVRIIARDPSRIPEEIRKRVEVVEGSHSDAAIVDSSRAADEVEQH
jgi:Trk K+ transport system NAD-binding subunit